MAFRALGVDLVRWPPPMPMGWAADEADRAILGKVRSYTMTSPERVQALIDAVNYVIDSKVAGAIVECGVWRGGSMMAAALALKRRQEVRDLYLYDTFEGMTEPTAEDVDMFGRMSSDVMAREERREDIPTIWAYAPLERVRRGMSSTGYEASRVHYVQGPVEQTIPGTMPSDISILRLDTDWYASTKHELEHLYPRLSPRGVLIIDDYGHHGGSRKATNEFLERHPLLLCRIDAAARLAVKC